MEDNKIVIYQTEDGQTQIDVRLENETVWLTQAQMAELFKKDRTVITRHINNIFKEGELEKEEVCAKFAHTTRHGAIEGKQQIQEIVLYNLDVIISVGYRVKSKRGTAFRIWARNVLKDYLVKGYAVNERIRKEQIGELRQLVGMLGRTIHSQPLLSTDETNALFEVVTDYTYALDTLDNYDYERLTIEKTTKQEVFHATYENAMQEINQLREKFGGSVLFGNEKDDSFKSTMSSGMCKFCTHLFFFQLTFLKNIINVASYNSSVFLKKFSHLSLCQPHRLVLQSDIDLCLSVFCLIDYNFVLVHFYNQINPFCKDTTFFLYTKQIVQRYTLLIKKERSNRLFQ